MVRWTPGPRALSQVLQEQNPWYAHASVPISLAPKTQRPFAQLLWRRLLQNHPRRFQLVLGPRRVGNTTVLYQTVRALLEQGIPVERIWWLRMDHPLLIQADLGDLVRAVLSSSDATSDRPVFLMLDELVYAKSWDLWLKTFYDEQWPVRIAATSSATAALRERRHESGVGRWEDQYLMPFTFGELLDLIGEPQPVDLGATLAETLQRLPMGQPPRVELQKKRQMFMLVGGFPELLTPLSPDQETWQETDTWELMLRSQQVLRRDAIERTVYKDIPQSFGVNDPMDLERLLYVLAGQMTGVLSPSSISSNLGIAQPTFDRYLSYLDRAFLVFTLTNYAGSEAKIQRRGRKLYFVDSAVRNAALQRGIAPLSDPAELGLLLENLVATSIRTLAAQTMVRLHYWRSGSLEVDLIYEDPRQPLAFEIGSSARHSQKGLRALIRRFPRFRGNSYLITPQAAVIHAEETESGVGTLPLDTFLLAISAQAKQALAARLGVFNV